MATHEAGLHGHEAAVADHEATVRDHEAAAVRGVAPARAARELELRRGEFDLAVQLGHIRTTRDADGGPPRVGQAEIDRLRGAKGFPDTLRARVRAVGTVEGAALVTISPARFTRLARTGHFTPVRFYLNRYRTVVWLYLADELREFARDHAELLTGRTPPAVLAALAAGEDRRARNWRGRRLGLLLRSTADPWERAAAIAAVLDPVTTAEVVPDPYERSHLRVLRPSLAPPLAQSPAAQEVVAGLLLADHPDEILWHRVSLADALREARRQGPAPRPEPARTLQGLPDPAHRRSARPGTVRSRPARTEPAPARPARPTRRTPLELLARLRRRKSPAACT
ncbi:DUF6397 family protein [Streptomyces sp. NPDC002187]|uniref:DUF6397 family protein n=1 Tax=Streptomyces sp. NPDC002187 TaxID=3364637 RepID=UPI0036C272A5